MLSDDIICPGCGQVNTISSWEGYWHCKKCSYEGENPPPTVRQILTNQIPTSLDGIIFDDVNLGAFLKRLAQYCLYID